MRTSLWLERLRWAAATCLGLGYTPVAPGTAGALPGVAIYGVVAWICPAAWHGALLAAALFAVVAVTVGLGGWAERRFAEKDSSRFVTDEVAGFLLTALLFRAPSFDQPSFWWTTAWAFPVTRVVDMIKIPPSRSLEKLPSGWGVVADDLMASLYAATLLHAIAWAWPEGFGG